MTLNPNTTVSHYRILSSIGKGGMGEVYLAQDTELDRKAAIKFLNEDLSKDSEKVNRFIQEAKAASALNHPNILTVYEIGAWEDTRYIATEYIEGETLREIIRRKESIPLNKVLKIGIQVAEALSAAHRAGIAHRDIKPENIMVRDDGYVKVLDFGLAKLTEKKRKGDISLEGETKALVKTNPGVVMGTVSYMSPEQARGQETDERTDIWSLGVVLYEMLSGKVPFSGETTNHTIVAILETEPKLLENIPDELQRIVRKTLTKDKAMRYQNTGDLVIDLKNLRRDLDIQGELERSIVPNRETEVGFGETASVPGSSGETATASGAMSTQNLTSTSSLEYAVIQAKSHKLATGAIALVLIGVVSAITYFGFFKARPEQINSIAVIPFVNESKNADVEYLSDGMTETLINSLSQVPGLNVKARSLVFRYKGKEIEPKKVAAELGVQAILTGRVLQRGDELTLNVELTDGETENTIWGNSYVRKASDLVALQGELARDVTNTLKSKLSRAEAAKVEDAHTVDPEAYQLYLKGRYAWNRRTTVSLKQAADFFKKAIEKDPNYALAYAGLADTYALFMQYDVAPTKESMPLTKAAAMKALELDDSMAAPHAALGTYYTYFAYDRASAEREYRRAIELDPNYATAYQWLAGDVLETTRRFDEAFASLKRAEELDPLSPIIGTNRGDAFLYAGRYDDAIKQYERVRSFDPGFGFVNYGLGVAYWQKGMKQEAIAAERKYVELSDASLGRGTLGYFLAKSGEREEAVKILEDLTKSDGKIVQYYAIAIIHLGLGDKEKALDWLEKEVEEHGPNANYYAVNLELKELYGEPRFKALLKRLGLPE